MELHIADGGYRNVNYRPLNQELGYPFDIVALHVRCYVYDRVLVLTVVVVAAPEQLEHFQKFNCCQIQVARYMERNLLLVNVHLCLFLSQDLIRPVCLISMRPEPAPANKNEKKCSNYIR